MDAPSIEFRGASVRAPRLQTSLEAKLAPPHPAGDVYKRSEWLRNWNARELVVSPRLLSWFSGETQTGSLVLEKNCFITTTEDDRLVVQSGRREVQFRCHDTARLSNWLHAVQSAARPVTPGGAPSSAVAEDLPTTAALSTFAGAIGAQSCSPPPPPQLLDQEAVAQINWGTVGALSPAWSPLAPEHAPHLTTSRPAVLADGLQTDADQPVQEPQQSRDQLQQSQGQLQQSRGQQWIELEPRHDAGRIQGAGLTKESLPRQSADRRRAGQRPRSGASAAHSDLGGAAGREVSFMWHVVWYGSCPFTHAFTP